MFNACDGCGRFAPFRFEVDVWEWEDGYRVEKTVKAHTCAYCRDSLTDRSLNPDVSDVREVEA